MFLIFLFSFIITVNLFIIRNRHEYTIMRERYRELEDLIPHKRAEYPIMSHNSIECGIIAGVFHSDGSVWTHHEKTNGKSENSVPVCDPHIMHALASLMDVDKKMLLDYDYFDESKNKILSIYLNK